MKFSDRCGRHAALAATLLLVASACSTDTTEEFEVHVDHPIEFASVAVEMAETGTRGFAMSATQLNTSGFAVWAVNTGADNYRAGTDYAAAHVNNMWPATVSLDGAAWTYSPKAIWPTQANAALSFFAVTPAAPTAPFTAGPIDVGAGLYRLALGFRAAGPIGQAAVEPMVASVVDKGVTAFDQLNLVSFTFRHVLARVGFVITNSMDNVWRKDQAYQVGPSMTDVRVSIYGAQMPEPREDSRLFFDNPTLLDTPATAWVNVNSQTGYTTYDATPYNWSTLAAIDKGASQATPDGQYYLFLPGGVSGLKIRVDYNVTVAETMSEPDKDYHCYKEVSVPASVARLDMGKAYNFRITLSGDPREHIVTP